MKLKINTRKVLFLVIACVFIFSEVPSWANIFVYPKEGQGQAEQQRDQGECYTWAQRETGYNPYAPRQQYTYQSRGAVQGSGLRGAGMGAARGAIIGGISDGDTGNAALAGMVMGAVGGRLRSQRHQQDIADAQNQVLRQQQDYGYSQYLRACKACLEAKGYSVS